MIENQSSGKNVVVAMAGVSLLAIPLVFIQSKLDAVNSNPMLLMLFAIAMLAMAGALAYVLAFRKLPKNTGNMLYLVSFAFFAFAAVADLLIALTLMGFTDVMQFYFEGGEPYLKSAYGMSCNFWDGTVHLALYLWMGYCLGNNVLPVKTALFWAGSILGSCLVYMSGNLVGDYAEHIEPSILLNIPFMAIPVLFAYRVMNSRKASAGPQVQRRWTDQLLVLSLLAVAVLCAFRMLVVLNPELSWSSPWVNDVEPHLLSSSRYPEIQMLALGIYLLPFAIIAAMSFWYSRSQGLSLWAWIIAGLVAQAQFAHIMGSVSAAGGVANLSGGATFWAVNMGIMLVPSVFAWRYSQGWDASAS